MSAYDNWSFDKLIRRADKLRYDVDHLLDADKRQQASRELEMIESEIASRSGLNGIIRTIQRILKK